MFKKFNKNEKIAFAITMVVMTIFSIWFNWFRPVKHEVKIEGVMNSYGSYRMNQNWLKIAVHGDTDEIVGYLEIPAEGNLDYLPVFWRLAPEDVNQDNFIAKGYDRLLINYPMFKEYGRYIVPDHF